MKPNQQRKVLVTGAAGFIGFEVAKEAALRGYTVTAFDGLLEGLYPAKEKSERWESLASIPNVSRFEADLRTVDWVEVGESFDYIINLAAMPGLALSWDNFELYEGCNFSGVASLLKAAQTWQAEKFIQISTSSVYGLSAVGNEESPLNPVSPYGVTKLAAEKLLMAHYQTNDFPVAVLRYFSVYGPGQRPDMAYRRFIEKALRDEPITVFGDGSQSRSNTYVADVAKVTVDALDRSVPGHTYNICGGQETSILDAVTTILELTQSKSKIVFEDRIPGDQDKTAGDSSKAAEILGFRPQTLLIDGLSREIDFLAKR